ncbi:MAG TPA: carboxypeptidase-like regulatory domain-containing protein [Terriglobia bacterium]|nr:carboxypeptidase-like regulatory domain-containing protein [Terriglobia bacterium]
MKDGRLLSLNTHLSRRFAIEMKVLAALVICITFVCPLATQAQVATASINGTVTDSSGAVVPAANVILKNVATNVERSTVTNDSGNYVLVDIPPGRYTLRVAKEGFTSASQSEFELYVNQTSTYDFALRVGSTTQTVTVEATAAALQTSTSELGAVITGRAVSELPLNGRNFTQLLNLTPGVSTVNVAQNASSQQFDGNTVGSFSFPSINGQTNRSNFFLVDGLNDQESFASTYSVPPIIDDIQEFKVDSHNDQAQFGGVLGGVVNVATKSGTNNFHGAAWEFLRNNAFDARGPFDTNTNQLQQNEFGANIGGPVILPHYNGRNKTFFFGSYEGARIHSGNPNRSRVATAAELNGDFSADGVTLFNPWSTDASGKRTSFQCDASGNPEPLIAGTKLQVAGTNCSKIPAALIDANMQKVGQMLYSSLSPNLTGIANVNFQKSLLNTQSPDTYNFRIDEQAGAKDAIWGRFSHTSSPRLVPNIFGAINANSYTAHTFGVTWNHTFGPSALLSVQFGRNYGFSAGPTLLPANVSQQLIAAGNWDPSFDCSYLLGPRKCYFTGVNISGIASFQEGTAPAIVTDIWEEKANFFKTLGRHNISLGADFNTNGFQQTFNTGHLDYSGAQTASATSSGKGGFGFASFLLGIPNTVNYRNEFETEYGGKVDGFYFQDQWKVTDRLTVNWGARYDVTFLPIFGSNKDGNAPVGNMDYNTGNYVIQRVPGNCSNAAGNGPPPCIPQPVFGGGALPPHVLVSKDGHFWHNSYDNIQPRLGIAYRLGDKTAVRASFGRFFDNWAAVIQMAQNQQGVWPSVGQVSNRPLNQNPGPPTVLAENPGVGLALDPTPYRQSNWFVDPNLQNPYSYQWNFGVQQALTPSTVLTVNYVGSTDHRLDVGVQGNQALTPGAGPSPNGCLGITSGCTDNSATVAAQGRWLFPYLATNHYDKSIGKGWYHALQVSLDKKASHGLSYLVAYTWSKTISVGADEWFGTGSNGTSVSDPYHIQNDKGLAGFDLPQILTASFVYELPFGAGRKWQSGSKGVDAVIGGWQLNGISNFTSGTLFNVVASNSIPNVGTTGVTERAFLCGKPTLGNPTPAQWFNNAPPPVDSTGKLISGACGTGGAFGIPLSQTFGNFGRNVLRGDGRANFDLSIFRSFRLSESKRLEFRGEAFNFSNSPIWGTPGNNISSIAINKDGTLNTAKNTFGVVTGTANAPRILQFALKFYF